MKIGFSLGRCIRDIVNEKISIDDVAFIITSTSIHTKEQLADVILMYTSEPMYLYNCDYDKCVAVANMLWDNNRLLQPRRQGLQRHAQPENAVWVDMFPTVNSDNESVKTAWDAYRFMLHMVENVDQEAMAAFK
jgi:hypothetical protein